MAAKDAASNDASLTGLADVGDTTGQDGIAIVSAAVPGQETDKALEGKMLIRWENHV